MKTATKKRKRKSAAIRWLLVLLVISAAAAVWAVSYCIPPLHSELRIEAGSLLPEAKDFLKNTDRLQIRFQNEPDISTSVPGTYPVTLICCDIPRDVAITVVDTTPPTGTLQEMTLVCPEQVPAAEEFVVSATDLSPVSVAYQTEPVIDTAGEQDVTILLTDASGNTTALQTVLKVIWDTTAPVISGVQNLEVYAGGTVSYRSGITVTDDSDGSPVLSIDSSAVDLSQPGQYTLVYTATDEAGNSSEASATVTVLPKKENHVDPEVIYAEVDAILAKFITEDMSVRDKVEAVYCWTRIHTNYDDYSDKDDWLQAAYQFMITRKGDCFSYFALNKLMLQRLGIPTIDVYKVKNYPEDSSHFWLLVSIDGGETYYHMDNIWSKNLCLVTDRVLDAFSKENKNCFNRDKSLYPATPEKSLPKTNLPWNNELILNA